MIIDEHETSAMEKESRQHAAARDTQARLVRAKRENARLEALSNEEK